MVPGVPKSVREASRFTDHIARLLHEAGEEMGSIATDLDEGGDQAHAVPLYDLSARFTLASVACYAWAETLHTKGINGGGGA